MSSMFVIIRPKTQKAHAILQGSLAHKSCAFCTTVAGLTATLTCYLLFAASMHLQGIALAGAMQHSCVFIFPSLEAKSIGEKGYIRHDGFLACTVDDSGFVGIQQLPASAFVSTELLSSI
eukprot:CAMPEP_0206521386 /NCGR_PEP_ID=MMETSP0324_2-20121206/66294_1 /ASSEMBLY_ACC=CAM_ASM_000836 /TAXON_ID=2866 /ORGANISM="Crypthecodinium cohnii, Strain Seligo" /LENGTH=119 /DNA_ID=CAMNT_0054015225 /DNA_START=122 /DNA_END=478 /DNA_ORIENTATION=+